jgi:hypothetical protein
MDQTVISPEMLTHSCQRPALLVQLDDLLRLFFGQGLATPSYTMIFQNPEYRTLSDAVLRGERRGRQPSLVVSNQLGDHFKAKAPTDVVDPTRRPIGTFELYSSRRG